MNNSKTPSFSIIIPNFNGADFLPNCLNSLYQSIQGLNSFDFEVILVDNNSHDDSIHIFKSLSLNNSQIKSKIIRSTRNYGFAGAVNKGIKAAKFSWVVLLNNDITLSPDWFKLVVAEIKKHPNDDCASFCGTVLNKTGDRYESQGLKFYYEGKCINISNQKLFESETLVQTNQFIWGSSAALVIYRKDIILKIGLFDTDFFAYEEDVDVALRLHNINYKTIYIPQAISYHLGGGTSSKMGNFRNRMDAKNWCYIIIKNYTLKQFIKHFPDILEERLRNLSGLIKTTCKTYRLKSIYLLPIVLLTIYGQVILTLPKMLKKRQFIKTLKPYDNRY